MTKSLCGACNQTFSCVTAFAIHRTGSFYHKTRRCTTKEEMQASGLIQNKKGWWTTPASGRAPWAQQKKELAATTKTSP